VRDRDDERYERLLANLRASMAAADYILNAHFGCNCEFCQEVRGISYVVGLMESCLACTLPEAAEAA
jgi:hypothetical protein